MNRNLALILIALLPSAFPLPALLANDDGDNNPESLKEIFQAVEQKLPSLMSTPLTTGTASSSESWKGNCFASSGFVWRDITDDKPNAFHMTVHHYALAKDVENDIQENLFKFREANPEKAEPYKGGHLYRWKSSQGHVVFQYGLYICELNPSPGTTSELTSKALDALLPILVKLSSQTTALGYSTVYPTNPVMLDQFHGWWLKETGDHFQILQTQDGGVHWQIKSASPSDQIISQTFLNEHEGYLLAASDPACGIQHKVVYHTSDGGKNWQVMASPPQEGLSYYATSIVFRSPKDGWITGTYHGAPDAPLYRTTDGAESWKPQQIQIPLDYQGGYADIDPPVFIGPDGKRGYLPVKLVRHEPKPGHIAWVNYESDDGGNTWHLPTAGFQSESDN